MNRCSALGASVVVGMSVGTGGAFAAPPVVDLSVAVDGKTALVLPIVGVDLPDGIVAYTGLKLALNGQWSVSWNLTADLNPEGDAYLTGVVTAENKTAETHEYTIDVSFPLDPVIKSGTTFGGSLVMKLKTNADGGELTCDERGNSIWTAKLGRDEVQKLFYCPFSMTSSGAGSLTTTADFGVPIPSLPGPLKADSIGTVVNGTLTAGEKLTVTSLFVVAAGRKTAPEPPESCIADINEDGLITSADLGLLLSKWGEDGQSEEGWNADINGDGTVNAGDLGLLLGYWGQCTADAAS